MPRKVSKLQRTFQGKKFNLFGFVSTKEKAERLKKYIKREGRVRVTKCENGYNIWIA